MITLTTAVPGEGKTLRVVGELLALRDEERRNPDKPPRLIFTNINGLDPSLNCCVLADGRDWLNVPDGSLVVLDECQRFFPPRPSGAKVPDYIQFFDTHRHQGIDIWLLTQHPKMIDGFIRCLVGYHRHGYRPYGLSYAIWSEWQTCNENPPMPSKPEQKKITHDRRVFGLYKSSVEHTHTPRHPWKIYAKLAGSVLFVIACVVIVAHRLLPPAAAQPSPPSVQKSAAAVESPALKAGPVSIPSSVSAVQPATAAVVPMPQPVAETPPPPQLLYQGWAKDGEGNPLIVLCNQSVDRNCADPSSTYKLSQFGAWRLKNGILELFMSPGDDNPAFVVNNPKMIADARELGINI